MEWSLLDVSDDLNSPLPTSGSTVIQDNHLIYIFGGFNEEQKFSNVLSIFDPEKLKFIETTGSTGNSSKNLINLIKKPKLSIPEPRERHCGILFKEKHVYFGGIGVLDGQKKSMNDLWTYVPEKNKHIWNKPKIYNENQTNSIPKARYSHTMVLKSSGEAVILFGGISEEECFNDIWFLTVKTSLTGDLFKWTQYEHKSENFPSPRFDHSSTICNSKM
jgi:hypothetical protein